MSIVVTPIPRLIDLAAPAFTLGTSNAAGSAATAVASDSTLLAFDTTVPDAITYGQSGAAGTAVVTSRRDHAHAMAAEPTTFLITTVPANQTITNSTTLVNVSGMVSAVLANTTYAVELGFSCDIRTASDAKFLLTLPTDGVLAWWARFNFGTGTIIAKDGVTGGPMVLIATTNGINHVNITGQIIIGDNAGNAQLQFAQNSAVAENTIMYEGGWMRLTQL